MSLSPRAGVTLLELLVALTILGITAGAALLVRAPVDASPGGDVTPLDSAMGAVRRSAVRSGRQRVVSLRVDSQGRVLDVADLRPDSHLVDLVARPDGSVTARHLMTRIAK